MKYNTNKQKISRHDPLANRIVDALVHKFIQGAIAHATATNDNDETYRGILNMQGALEDYWIHLTPKIVDELQRAGLLIKPEEKKTSNE